MDNKLIQDLKSQHATLRAEYENLGVTFKADYPQMRQLKARMDDVEARIATWYQNYDFGPAIERTKAEITKAVAAAHQ